MKLRQILLGGLVAALSLTGTSALAVNNGTQAPDFSLPGHDGKSYSLSQFKGKHVVLEWFNNDCPYVEKHYGAGNMQQLQKKYTGQGVVWLTIASSAPGKQGHLTAEAAKKVMAARKASPSTVLLDPSGKVGKLYAAQTTPHMYIIDPTGKLVYQGAIDDKPSARPTSLSTATPLFANALDAALAGKAIVMAKNKPYGCAVKY
ncbi:MAG: thioredoxin family protein [Candidatus Sericytochromatia bacterium]|nr:thioredoxin family protein [Candidatus Sericytochromatia bacterium]